MKIPNEITNYDDVIDSRDIIARIDWLTDTDDPDELEELSALTKLANEIEGYSPDWYHGVALVRESYFTEYVMEMLSDIGDLPRDVPHYLVIDEEATAENIKMDYTEVDFDGVPYYIR